MKRTELVFIPSPGMGHLISAVEMAKVLADRNEQLSITVLIIDFPYDPKIISYTKSLSESSIPRMKFVNIVLEESFLPQAFTYSLLYELIDLSKGRVREVLAEISNSEISELAAIVLDMFCTSMIDVADEFRAPSYIFYTCGAAALGLAFHLQSLRDDFKEDVTEYKDKDINLAIPTYLNTVPTKVLPAATFDKEGGCKAFLDHVKRYRDTKGIIINTCFELESHAVEVLSKDPNIPPVYTAGPILNLKNKENPESELLLKWLDLQPNSSVVFLCFGSYGFFSTEQVKEIAIALENSGHRFLWPLRKPPPEDKFEAPGEYENLEEVLPEGFLKRTAETGKVIGWAPQVAVLSHPAVGGFMSHCGWNSTLESVWCGVPMATWPIYAEQQLNAFQMVKDLEMAVEIKMDYRKVFGTKTAEILNSELIEEKIRCLMDPENEIIRNKVKEMQRNCRLAVKEGGSSYSSLKCLIDNVISRNP